MLPTDGATRWAAGEEAMHSLEDERSRLIIGVGLKNSPIVKQLSKLPTRGSHREARVSLDIYQDLRTLINLVRSRKHGIFKVPAP